MTESYLKRRVIAALSAMGQDPHTVSAELGGVRPGTPDVECVSGWIELKEIEAWPKRAKTPVRIEHFTREQRIWLQRRWHAGGRASLLLQVADTLLLFNGCRAARYVGLSNRDKLETAANRIEHKTELEEILLCALRLSPPVKSCSCGAKLRG